MFSTKPLTANKIEPTASGLVLILADRRVRVAWEDCSVKLAEADLESRLRAELSPGGYGIHWPLLDEDLSVQGLVQARGG